MVDPEGIPLAPCQRSTMKKKIYKTNRKNGLNNKWRSRHPVVGSIGPESFIFVLETY